MRDLARGGLLRRRKKFPVLFVKVVVLVLAIGFVVWFLKTKTGFSGGGGSVILSAAPRGLTPVQLSDDAIVDAGGNIARDTAVLKQVDFFDDAASGTVSRSFGGGVFVMTVDAKLADIGDKYQLWLVSGDDFFDGGFLSGSDGAYSVTFRNSRNFSSYDDVWITRERTTEDGAPEQEVLVGNF